MDSLQALPASAEAQQALEALQALQGAKFGQGSEKASPKALQSALEALNRKAQGDKQTKAQFRLYS